MNWTKQVWWSNIVVADEKIKREICQTLLFNKGYKLVILFVSNFVKFSNFK